MLIPLKDKIVTGIPSHSFWIIPMSRQQLDKKFLK